jgi:hypothetical protein
MLRNATGFGPYDTESVETDRGLEGPRSNVRAFIHEIGRRSAPAQHQKRRGRAGVMKSGSLRLYGSVPRRSPLTRGFPCGSRRWSELPVRARCSPRDGPSRGETNSLEQVFHGTAPLLTGPFLSPSIRLFFVGVLGEHAAALHVHTVRCPLVIQRRRISFDRKEVTSG